MIESIAQQRNVRLDLNLKTPGAHIKVNPNEFQHVLRHLVRNSARAMQDMTEKKISVSTRYLLDYRVEIVFQDYGPGIKDEIRAAIFQRRTSTKTTSGGYGLLIARQLVEDIGGKITLLSAETGTGAAFSIKLPVTIKHLIQRKTGALNHVE
jgi:signal transduction histidine kinase